MTQTVPPLLNFPVSTDTARVRVGTEPEASLQVVESTFPGHGKAQVKLETSVRTELRAPLVEWLMQLEWLMQP
jgi:hypothetical protein